MSSYSTLRPLLRAACAEGTLDGAARSLLSSLPVGEHGGSVALGAPPYEPDFKSPPVAHPAWLQAHHEISLARGLLNAMVEDRLQDALVLANTILAAPMRPSPLETLLEELGAKLAAAAGDSELQLALVSRRDAYLQRYSFGAALVGAAAVAQPGRVGEQILDLLEPGPVQTAVAADEDEVVAATSTSPDDHDRRPAGNDLAPLADLGPSTSSFTPFAAEYEPRTNAYVVTLRHLQEARTATFAVHRVHWHDLDSDDPRVSDLVLAFEDDASSMLRSVDPELLSLRLFFGDGPAYDEVSTSNGSLFDVEVNPAEGRIYLKLLRPPAWSATDLPPADLWSNLRSCVLITEPG